HSIQFHAFPKRRCLCLCCAWIKQWVRSYHGGTVRCGRYPSGGCCEIFKVQTGRLAPYLTARADSRFWTLCSDFLRKKSTCIYPFFSRIVASACHRINPYSVVYVL